jgi:hypothetical protein
VDVKLNPYESPTVAIENPLPVYESGDYTIDEPTIIGGDEIKLPPVCVVSGSRDNLSLHTTKLRRISRKAALIYLAAYSPMFGVLPFNFFGPAYLPLFYHPGVALVLFFLVSVSLAIAIDYRILRKHRSTMVYWFRSKKERQAYRNFRVLTLLCVFLILIGGWLLHGATIGMLPFVAVISIVYSKKRFVYLKLIDRKPGLSRVTGFKPAFFKALRDLGSTN